MHEVRHVKTNVLLTSVVFSALRPLWGCDVTHLIFPTFLLTDRDSLNVALVTSIYVLIREDLFAHIFAAEI